MPRKAPNRRKLTELYVRKVRPQAVPVMTWDEKQRGLALRVEPSGYRVFKVVYRYHGRPRWYHIGAVGQIALADARKLAAEVVLEVIRGKDPAAEKRAARGAGTFADLAERYVEQHAKKRNKSWKQGDYLVRQYLLPKWGKLDSKSIARSDVRGMMSRIAAPVLANQVLAAASAIFSWAVKQELVAVNPCRGVERNETKSRERVLSDAELPLFWNTFDETGLLASSALKIILLTGQRPGEVAHMRWEHLQDGWWTMPGAPDAKTGWPGTKNKQTHRIWLPLAAQDVIAELSDEDQKVGQPTFSTHGFVFTTGRRAIGGLDGAMRTVCNLLNAERATPHDLRRTHGTRITELGFGREAMNRVQNHREGGIADVYDRHEYAEENKRLMEAVSQRIIGLATGKAGAANVVRGKFR
jgi:integrase